MRKIWSGVSCHFIYTNRIPYYPLLKKLLWSSSFKAPVCCPEGNYFLLPSEVCCDLPRRSGTLAAGQMGMTEGNKVISKRGPRYVNSS